MEGGGSLAVAAAGTTVQVWSIGVIGTSVFNATKVNLEIKAMKSEGGSSSSSETGSKDLGETKEEQKIKDDFDNLTAKEKEVFEKYEKNGWKGQYGKNGPSHAGGDFDNNGEGGGQILPEYEADGVTPIEYKEFDINNVKPRDCLLWELLW